MTKVFNGTREVVGKLAPFILMACFPLHILLIFLDSSYDAIKVFKNVSYILMLASLAFWGVYFVFNIVHYAKNLKSKTAPSEDEFYNHGKLVSWGVKHYNLIKLILNSVACAAMLLPLLIAAIEMNQFYYFDVYFAVWIALAVLFVVFAVNALLFSKNKTTFVMSWVFLTFVFGLLIASAVFIFDMYFGFGSNKRLADILLIFVVFPMIVLQFKDVAFDDIKKSKRNLNIFLGVISLILAVFIFVAKDKCIFYIEEFIAREGSGKLSNSTIPFVNIVFNAIKYIFLSIVLVSILNFGFGVRYYYKKRDILGFVDLAASVAAVIVGFFALTGLSEFLTALIP